MIICPEASTVPLFGETVSYSIRLRSAEVVDYVFHFADIFANIVDVFDFAPVREVTS